MYDIHAYFEHEPDRALHWIREMWRRHPGWPIWGLKLAQLLGEPMGLWAQSAAVARDIVLAADAGRHPNYQSVAAAMARVLLAEALLGDLRFEEARETARAAIPGAPATPWVRERAERVLARCGDLERRASSPEGLALSLLARSRRCASGRRALRRGGLSAGVALLPTSDEGRLCAARESLRRGRPAAARELARAVLTDGATPWLRPSASLVLAHALEGEGERARGPRALPSRVGAASRARGAAQGRGRGDPAPRSRRDAPRCTSLRAIAGGARSPGKF